MIRMIMIPWSETDMALTKPAPNIIIFIMILIMILIIIIKHAYHDDKDELDPLITTRLDWRADRKLTYLFFY